MKRDQFTFYRSYYEALKHLPKRDRADVLMAVIGYALDEEIPKLSGVPLSVFTLIRPTLDSGRNKAKNRLNKQKTNQEQTGTKQEQNGKEGESEREVEKELEREVESECEGEGENDSSLPLPPSRAPGRWPKLFQITWTESIHLPPPPLWRSWADMRRPWGPPSVSGPLTSPSTARRRTGRTYGLSCGTSRPGGYDALLIGMLWRRSTGRLRREAAQTGPLWPPEWTRRRGLDDASTDGQDYEPPLCRLSLVLFREKCT